MSTGHSDTGTRRVRICQCKWCSHNRRTLQSRSRHTSAVFYTDSINGNIMLAGGFPSHTSTTEIVPDDHDQDVDVTEGFGLKHKREGHCSIQLDHDGFILTGGRYGNSNEVTEYSFRGEGGSPKDLPPLKIGRWDHACGAYTDNVHGSEVIFFVEFFPHMFLLRCLLSLFLLRCSLLFICSFSDAHCLWRTVGGRFAVDVEQHGGF